MKLAFSGKGRYADYTKGYDLYVKRNRGGVDVDKATYARIVREYCRMLADDLLKNGIADMPCALGTIAAATLTRKPQYRGKHFIGYGKWDFAKRCYDGTLKAFGMVYLPRYGKIKNLRSLGFVANRQLFKKMKEQHQKDSCPWVPIDFEEDMI